MKENKLEKEKEMRWEMWEITMEGMLEVSLPPEIQLWDEMSDWSDDASTRCLSGIWPYACQGRRRRGRGDEYSLEHFTEQMVILKRLSTSFPPLPK
jgi:hypothetical protein